MPERAADVDVVHYADGSEPKDPTHKPFDQTELLDRGLLHYFNRTAFWPHGLSMVQVGWRTGDRLIAKLRPRMLWAAAQLTSETAPIHLDTDKEVTAFVDALLRTAFAPDQALVLQGFELIDTIPPEVIVSDKSKDEQRALMRSARAWLSERRRVIKP